MKIPGISPAETQHLSYEDTTVIYTCLITRLHNEVLKYDENKRLKIGTKTKLDPIWSLFRFAKMFNYPIVLNEFLWGSPYPLHDRQ